MGAFTRSFRGRFDAPLRPSASQTHASRRTEYSRSGVHAMPLFPSQPLEQVRVGMSVVDASSAQLGKVIRVHMGDPKAVTIAGNEPPGDVLITPVPPDMDAPASMMGTPPVWGDPDALHEVPEPVRRHLLRSGFIEIDGTGLHGAERFIPGDWVSNVSGERVVVRRQPSPGPSASV